MDAAKYDQSKIELLKATYAKGATDTELQLFLTVAQHRGLDPFSGQICFVKRKQLVDGEYKEVGTFQVSIDGYRSMAARANDYMPSENLPTFTYKADGKTPDTATVECLKWHEGSKQWMRIKAIAYYDEFVQTTRDGKPNHFWGKMPHNQLAKCGEALVIRKGWPQQVEGLDVEGVEALPPAVEGEYKQIAEAPGATEATAKIAAPQGVIIPAAKPARMNFILENAAKQKLTAGDVNKMVKDELMRPALSACTDEELMTLCKRFAGTPDAAPETESPEV
jgi:phage recombination protein Bet